MVHRAGLNALLTVAVLGVFAPPSPATLRVESTNRGLSITDKNNLSDFVQLRLLLGLTTPVWEIEKSLGCGFACFDVFRFDFGSGCRAEGDRARCDRLGPGVNVNLKGGNDNFLIFDSQLPISDPMTLDLGAGNDSGDTGLGSDTILGGPGNDGMTAGAGNDVMDGGDGDDFLKPGEGADLADGGAGNDAFSLGTPARDETDDIRGGLGGDIADYTGRQTPVRIIEANLQTLAGEKDSNENDVLTSIEVYNGTEQGDIITGVLSANPSNFLGFAGDDQLFGTSTANTLTGGGGADQISSKAGDDVIDAKSGESPVGPHTDPVIDCGAGTADVAVIDSTDDKTPTGCESVSRSPLGEGPHVLMSFGRPARVTNGGASAMLSCPRRLRSPCAGTLELRVGASRTVRTDYSIRPGRSTRVRVKLGKLEGRIGRRTVGALVSLERGLRGRKTTERRIVLSG